MGALAGPFQEVLEGLQRSSSKQIPFSLLYDDKGSELYEQIVELDEYYPYAAETHLLEEYAPLIVRSIPADCVLVELGCGSATKSGYLLNAFHSLHGRCHYVGIDVSQSFLKQAHTNLLGNVHGLKPSSLHFIQADYMEGLTQARQAFPNKLFCVMWLGSSIGNLVAEDAVSFLKKTLSIVGPNCLLFLCADQWKDTSTLYKAYHDDKGVTEAFIKNGMKNALALLGHTVSKEELDSWSYHVQINSKLRRVEMWVTFPSGLCIQKHNVHIRRGESVLVEFSRKFTVQDLQELATRSNFYIQGAWRSGLYGCQILYSNIEALRSCWNDTDTFFDSISDWKLKPIDLRHPFLFYYGHLSAFTKLKLFDEMEVTEMDIMFSRGIDPSVLDPFKCHNHPQVPPEWPSREALCAYVGQVRSMVTKAVMDGTIPMRLVCFLLEHERMHHETLAYMLSQQIKANFKRTFSTNIGSNGESNGQKQDGVNSNDGAIPKCNIPNVKILPGKISMGSQQSDSMFVWDNEVPLVETFVTDAFIVSRWPVSIEEYMEFVRDGGYDRKHLWENEDFVHFKENGYKWPATWSYLGGDFYIHGHATTKHWKEIASEPVFVSLAEAQAYCKWAGDFRVMKEEEYHRALVEDGQAVHALREGGWEWTSTPFKGFPGFKAMSEYEEYSSDFFDGQHFVLKGSSPATHPALIRDSFRNFYQRQYRYVFAKFRCCKALANEALAQADSNGSNSHYRSAVFGHV
ncbi:hypothetical protein GOP47_0025114 [Adiantum capillus-veneris]|uniref:Uncharacterized protein n=1 Tax=Adiantum capillus-veneris TaxID=13818 RepID=A0A9D4U318_ADICA|nr:hypothetical protein GOP47_0024596 [Adiantum capillus-veneris]KAI5060694.1 hypothetical protein GOP47_0025114 [Adiantum capillus-veneris]